MTSNWINEELNRAREERDELRAQLLCDNLELDTTTRKLDTITRELEATKIDRDDLRAELHSDNLERDDEIARLESELEERTNDCDGAQRAYVRIADDCAELRTELADAQEREAELAEELDAAEAERDEVKAARGTIFELRTKIKDMESEAAHLEWSRRNRDGWHRGTLALGAAELRTAEVKLEAMTAERDDARAELDRAADEWPPVYHREIGKARRGVDELMEKLAATTAERDDLYDAVEGFRVSRERQVDLRLAAEAERDAIEAERNDLFDMLEKARADLKLAQGREAAAHATSRVLEAEQVERAHVHTSLLAELAESRAAHEAFRAEFEDTKADLKLWQEREGASTAYCMRIEVEQLTAAQELEDVRVELKRETSSAEWFRGAWNRAAKERNAASEQRNAAQLEAEELKEQLAEKSACLRLCEGMLEATKNEATGLRRELHALGAERDELGAELSSSFSLASVSNLLDNRAELRAERDAAISALEKANAERDDAVKETEQCRAESPSMVAISEALQAVVDLPTSKGVQRIAAEIDASRAAVENSSETIRRLRADVVRAYAKFDEERTVSKERLDRIRELIEGLG